MPLKITVAQTLVPALDSFHYQLMSNAIGEGMVILVRDFLGNCESVSKRLATFVEAGDLGGFRELCHEIKGTAAMLGFTGIASCLTNMEATASVGKFPDARVIAEAFTATLAATNQLLGAQD